jgi:hypothetical protein
MRAWQRHAWARKELLRRLPVALASLLLTFAMLSSFAHANGRYFYCEAMGLMATDPCVSASPRDEGNAAPLTEAREGHSDCCEVLTLPSLPQVTASASSAVPSPGLVAILPAAPLPSVQLGAPSVRPDRAREQWRPPPRSATQARAQLMVFLT